MIPEWKRKSRGNVWNLLRVIFSYWQLLKEAPTPPSWERGKIKAPALITGAFSFA
jgi:hypothetical protein